MSKLLERLDELLEAASIAEGSDESEYHWNNYVFALNAAHPKLKAVIEAAKLIEPYLEEDHKLVIALAALEE